MCSSYFTCMYGCIAYTGLHRDLCNLYLGRGEGDCDSKYLPHHPFTASFLLGLFSMLHAELCMLKWNKNLGAWEKGYHKCPSVWYTLVILYLCNCWVSTVHVIEFVKHCAEYSKMQQTFAQHLGSFKFQTIGEQSEDEKMISECHMTCTRPHSMYCMPGTPTYLVCIDACVEWNWSRDKGERLITICLPTT